MDETYETETLLGLVNWRRLDTGETARGSACGHGCFAGRTASGQEWSYRVHDAYVIDVGRLWRCGRRRRTAQGVAVFGAPGFADDADGLATLLGSHQRLADWMTAAGFELEVSAAGLQAVDVMIDRWREDPTIASAMSNDVGVFLGDVLLHEVSGSRWHVWPNGHPVVRLKGGFEIDVTAQTQTRVRSGQPHLGAVLDGARASTRTRSR